MHLRSPRERLLQTLCYEAGGLLLSIPLYLLYSGSGTGEGALLMLALSVAVMIWSPIHNTVFDWADLRLSGRVASDRPQRWRVVHAVTHEATTVVVTLPILVWLGGHGWGEALLIDLGLTVLYAVYAYGFHLAYDRWRPVSPLGAEAGA
ncbi:MAG: PACE efflux transporter [Tabrizicola sp.]|nr:PACE efflux transporter [Tabrizicola sp.]